MEIIKKNWIVGLVVAVLGFGLWWTFSQYEPDPNSTAEEKHVAAKKTPVRSAIPKVDKEGDAEVVEQAPTEDELAAMTEEERHKAIDREHMTKLHAGIFAFREKYGHYPEYLSQLAPEFVEAETLRSPKERKGIEEHTDPGLEKPYYGYEFSNLEFRDGRTFAEIKDIQRAEWGDVVPMLRAFGFSDGKVINMSYGGELYETRLNWEWDPATLDVVGKTGWGPGLDVGEFTEVHVKDAAGNPVAGAEVWADGRTYSFDLPNRPFTTDDNGLARIPLGADVDRTQLVLRVAGDGIAAPVQSFDRGSPPESHEFIVGASQSIGGTVVDANGQPVADTWVYLKSISAPPQDTGVALNPSGENLGVVKTDAAGNWRTALHPDDIEGIKAVVATPDVGMPKYAGGTAVDATDAANGKAVIVVGEKGEQ